MNAAPQPAADQGSRKREVFMEAMEIKNPRRRGAYLDLACGKDEALRKAVEELLQAEQAMGKFLELPAISRGNIPALAQGAKDNTSVLPPQDCVGQRIGRYKLLQPIGEGGCGLVYMAEQEEPVRRRVALKIIKLGMDTRQVIARFEAERQALAMMDHPNIARVLDAGATETGRPFFVMELVRGIKITDYCDQNNLSTADRLRLFIQVCHAIQHAHQKGIIHRDIKPSNVLVTLHDGTPIPKVIDFGVAKATSHQRLTDKTVFTAFEQFIGTPAYMSPEQAEMSGLDIDTRSDIYSLGVLLYELLTGKTPFDPEHLMRSGLDECRRTIRNDEPERPSNRLATMLEAELTTAASKRRTEAPSLISMLRGDLDWIVMKCLEKDRSRRYATAHALAVEVQRYLDGEPVNARPPSSIYRFQKFAKRNSTALLAGAAVAAAVLIGSVVTGWQAIRARHAEAQAYKAQQAELGLRKQAEAGWSKAREQAALARLNEYVAEINLVSQSLSAGNYGRAAQLLAKHRPQPGLQDQRGFEWRYLWQLSRGDPHDTLPQQDGTIMSTAISPNGKWLAVGLFEKVNILDFVTRESIAVLPKGGLSVHFSADSGTLITSGTGTVRAWRTADWSEARVLDQESGPVAISKDGKYLATTSRRGVRVWDLASWRAISFFDRAGGPCAFSPDGTRLAMDTDEGLVLRSLDGGAETVLRGSQGLFPRFGPRLRGDSMLAFSPDGKMLAAPRNTLSGSSVFILSLWDATTGAELGIMPAEKDRVVHTGVISSLAFSPDGKRIVSGSLDHSIQVWDVETRTVLRAFQGHLTEVWSVSWLPDSTRVLSGAKDGSLRLWSMTQKPAEDSIAGDWQPLGFSPDAKKLAVISSNHTVSVVNVITMEAERVLELTPARFRPGGSVTISSDFKTLAEGCEDGTARIHNLSTKENYSLRTGDRMVGTAILSGDGKQLITGGSGKNLRWWDLTAKTNVSLGDNAVRAEFSPDSKHLAVFGKGETLEIWSATTGAMVTNMTLDAPAGFAAAFSPDSKLLAITAGRNSLDDAIRLWDVSRGVLLGTFTGHKQGVFSLAFSPDGRTLASSSDDSTLKLWNVATRQELLTMRRLGGALTRLTFSPEGSLLLGHQFQAGELRFCRAPSMQSIDSRTRVESSAP